MAATVALLVMVASAPGTPPELVRLFPSGAMRGAEVEVTAQGKLEPWPVQVWTSDNALVIQCVKSASQLSVRTSPEMVPGIYWVRLFNEEGASAARPFVVGTLAEQSETEPNDDLASARLADPGSLTINGRLGRRGDVDVYGVRLAKDQTLVASLQANHVLGSPMDATLQIVSAGGFVLAENDDDAGLDPRLVFAAPQEGTYFVRTFAFPSTPNTVIAFAGDESFIYRLTLASTAGFVDYTYPLAISQTQPTAVELFGWNIPPDLCRLTLTPSDASETLIFHRPMLVQAVRLPVEPHAVMVESPPSDRSQPQPIPLPATVTGRIDPAGDVDVYAFAARKGDSVLFVVESATLGYPADPVLRVMDDQGQQLAEVDDSDGRTDPSLLFTARREGEHRIEVRDRFAAGGPRFVYRLRAVRPTAGFDLTVRQDAFVLDSKPLAIPVTVSRRPGFTAPVEVSARGLPEGVSAAPATSLGTGASAQSVTLTLTLASPKTRSSGPIEILGAGQGSPDTRQARMAGTDALAPLLWLTVRGQ